MRAWATWTLSAMLLACTVPGMAQVPGGVTQAPPPVDQSLQESARGHGSISVAFLDTLANGMVFSPNAPAAPAGSVRSYGIDLDLEYYYADQWSVRVGLPFLKNRYEGMAPHCPTTVPAQCQPSALIPGLDLPPLAKPHPESQFLDDGNFHGTWQDWSIGTAYHTNIGGYLLTPSITAYIPSHDYTFFANAAVGQDLWKVETAISLAHQFDFSNIYYRVDYGYVFVEQTLATSVNHSKLYLELGYFVNPDLAIRAFGSGKDGDGFSGAELVPAYAIDPKTGLSTEYWYHHDQIAEHNYFGLGVGLDYQLAHAYTLTSSVQKLVWGESVFNFKYAFELRITRTF